MRITFVAVKLNLDKGGSNPDLNLKIESLKQRGHEVKLITVFSDLNKLPNPLPCPVFEESILNRNQINLQRQIVIILKKYAPRTDVFYVEGHFLYGCGLYRKLGGKIPVIAFFNREQVCWPPFSGNFLKKIKHRIRFWLEKNIGVKLANRIDLFIFTSPQLENSYFNFGLKKGRSLVVPVFDDVIEDHEWANRSKKNAGVHKIFCAGRLVPEKRFDLIIKAVARLKNHYPINLVVGGSGPSLPYLKKTAAACGVEKITSFPGWLDKAELRRNFLNCDACVVSQWRPDISSVQLLEAMALETPCLVPKDTAFAWIAGAGAAVFRPDDINDLADQIARLIADKQLARQLGQAGLKRAYELDCRQLAIRLESAMMRLTSK